MIGPGDGTAGWGVGSPRAGAAGCEGGMTGLVDGTAGCEGGMIRPGNDTAGWEGGLEGTGDGTAGWGEGMIGRGVGAGLGDGLIGFKGLLLTDFGLDLINESFFCLGTGKTNGAKGAFSLTAILFEEISLSFCSLGKSMSRLKDGLLLCPVLAGVDTILYPYFLLNPPRPVRSTS